MPTSTRTPEEPRPRKANLLCRRALGRRGTVAVMVAVAIPGLLGIGGLAVEVGNWYVIRRQAQNAADLAAIAGAAVRNGTSGDTAAKTAAARNAALGTAALNGFDDANAGVTVTFNSPPTRGAHVGKADHVEVLVERTSSSALLRAAKKANDGAEPARSFFTRTISARGVASLRAGGDFCAYAKTRILLTGSSDINFNNCTAHSNGTADDALVISGNSSVRAHSITTSGLCAGNGKDDCTSFGSFVKTKVAQIDNPYADLDSVKVPASAILRHSAQNGNIQTGPSKNITWTGATFKPGEYRGISSGRYASNNNSLTTYKLSGNSSLTLDAGTYYFHNANLEIEGNSNFTCNGCTFVFTGDSDAQVGTLKISGNSTMNMTAPPMDGGDPGLGGMLFVRAGGYAGTSSKPAITSTGSSVFNAQGGQYFGNSYVKWTGNSSSDTNVCNPIVAGTLDFGGSSKVFFSTKGCQDKKYRAPRTTAGTFLVE